MPLTNGSTPVLVNTTTAESQNFSTVADIPGFGYVVIWQGPGYNPNAPLETGLYGQCYAYSGEKIGGEFLVSNNVLTGFKADADVIGGPGGTFTVTWSSFDSASLGIYMKTFFLGGSTVSPEVQVNTVTSGSEELSQVVRLSNGNIAVIWQGSGTNPGESGVFARLYDSSQQPLGDQFQVSTSPTGFNSAPSLTATFGGGFVATWSALGPNGNTDVYLQLIDHNGAKVGNEISVSTPGALNDLNPVIATLANGTYIMAWSAAEPGIGATEIYAQRFGLNGEKIGEQIHVTAGDFTGSRPAIAATPDGGFAVTYQASFLTMLRTFDQFGNAGDPWPIAEDVPVFQARPDIALLGDGSFIVSFHNGDIFAQRFRVTDHLTEGDDRAMGTGFSDYLEGFGGNDILRGGEGDDIIEGGLGADRMIGGGGRDEVTYANALSGVSLNLLSGGHGGEAQGDRFEEIEQFSLSRFGDRFIGGDGEDIVYGLAGDDILTGGKGFDILDGGDGNDVLEGGADSGDMLNGGEGFDEVTYVRDNFGLAIDLAAGRTLGAALRDTYFSIEKFTLTRFSDEFSGTDAVDRVSGGIGDDRLIGRGGDDVLEGNDGNDQLGGGIGADLLLGGTGNDVLDGGAGTDVMNGGTGDDLFMIDAAGDIVVEGFGGGRDVIYAGVSYMLAAGSAVEILSTISQAATTAIDLSGNALNQEIYGNAGANVIMGGGGTDWLFGFGGNDTYFVTGPGDHIVEQAGGGRDVVYASGSYTLESGVEIEVLSSSNQAGTGASTLIGNALAQEIYGNAGANVIDGGGGADYLAGLAGNDMYFIDGADDFVAEAAGGGRDAVYTGTSYALAAGQEVEVLSAASSSATAALDLTGNAFANELYGNAGANVLNGGAGADYLQGFGGADTFAFTSALGGGNVDALADFLSGTDRIALDDAVFTGLGLGALPAGAFVTGSAAADANDRIVYNSATGQLFYDADGNGAGAAVLFATLSGNPALAASDFLVI